MGGFGTGSFSSKITVGGPLKENLATPYLVLYLYSSIMKLSITYVLICSLNLSLQSPDGCRR